MREKGAISAAAAVLGRLGGLAGRGAAKRNSGTFTSASAAVAGRARWAKLSAAERTAAMRAVRRGRPRG